MHIESEGLSCSGAGCFLASRPDEREDPASDAGFRESPRIQRRRTDGISEGFSACDRRILLLNVASYEPKEIVDLLDRLGRRRERRTPRAAGHVIGMFPAQIGRMQPEEDDPDDRDPSNAG